MTAEHVKASTILSIAVATVWFCRDRLANGQLQEAERLIGQIMVSIQSGNLRLADEELVRAAGVAESVGKKRALSYWTRARERVLKSHLENLCAAYDQHILYVTLVVTNTVGNLKAARVSDEGSTNNVSYVDHGDDKTLVVLDETLRKLHAHNWAEADASAKRVSEVWKNSGVNNREISDALTDLPAIVRQNKRLAQEKWRARTDRIAKALKSGKMDAAAEAASAPIASQGADDQALKDALSRMISKLEVQDFSAADAAAREVARLLDEESACNEDAPVTQPELAEAVAREKERNRLAQQKIADEVQRLIKKESCRESSGFSPVLKGKVMVWDATKKEVETAYELLPDDMRASQRDGIVTIFSVIEREDVYMGTYSVSHQPAYKEKMTVGVAYWPECASAGTAIVWGGEPPFMRPVTYSPGYGSSVNIRDWIKGLPRETIEQSKRTLKEKKEKLAHQEQKRREQREREDKEQQARAERARAEEQARTDAIRARFVHPRVGSRITLELKRGGTVTGVLEALTEKTATVSIGAASVTANLCDLNDRSKALLTVDDFVRVQSQAGSATIPTK